VLQWQPPWYPGKQAKSLRTLDLGIDEDYKASGCFSEVIRGYQMGVIEPTTMHGFKAIRPIWVSLDVIIPSQGGITPEQWKQTATLCPLDWPTNYSHLRLWHLPTSLHQFANLLYKQLDHRHMFTQWSLNLKELAERALFQQPATYFTEAALQEHWRALDFPSRKLRRRPPAADLAAFRAKQADLRRNAVTHNTTLWPECLVEAAAKHIRGVKAGKRQA